MKLQQFRTVGLYRYSGSNCNGRRYELSKKNSRKNNREKCGLYDWIKKNQPLLYKDIEDYFKDFASEVKSKTIMDKKHGRIEKRIYYLLKDLSWLEAQSE